MNPIVSKREVRFVMISIHDVVCQAVCWLTMRITKMKRVLQSSRLPKKKPCLEGRANQAETR